MGKIKYSYKEIVKKAESNGYKAKIYNILKSRIKSTGGRLILTKCHCGEKYKDIIQVMKGKNCLRCSRLGLSFIDIKKIAKKNGFKGIIYKEFSSKERRKLIKINCCGSVFFKELRAVLKGVNCNKCANRPVDNKTCRICKKIYMGSINSATCSEKCNKQRRNDNEKKYRYGEFAEAMKITCAINKELKNDKEKTIQPTKLR